MDHAVEKTVRWIRRWSVAFIGILVLGAGIVMIVLPGPSIVVIAAGLAILATEFPWARRLLKRFQEAIGRMRNFAKRMMSGVH